MGFLSCNPFGGREIAPPQRRAPLPASECRRWDGGDSSVHGEQWPAPKAEGSWPAPTDTVTPLPSSPASSAGRGVHLQHYFPVLFNQEKKNHKRSGISGFHCQTILKKPCNAEENNCSLRPPKPLTVEQSFRWKFGQLKKSLG